MLQTRIVSTPLFSQNEQKVTSYYKNKLKQLYGAATTDAATESESLRKALDKIYEIKEMKNQRALADRPKPVSEKRVNSCTVQCIKK